MTFRPTSLYSGVWCALLVPIALHASSSESFPGLRRATLALSVALAAISLNASYALVYALAVEQNGGVLKLLVKSVVSDLFERRASAEVRVKREEERRAKSRRPSAYNARREANRSLVFNIVVSASVAGYLWKTCSQ